MTLGVYDNSVENRALNIKRDTGNIGIGTDNPTTKLEVNGTIRMSAVPGTNTNAALPVLFQTSAGNIDGGSSLTYNPGGDELSVNGNSITANTFRGAGNLVTLTCANGSGQYDFRATNDSLRFIAVSSEVGRFDNSGSFLIGFSTSTGTASQKLQVTGGAYVSDNLGIGTTNPTSKLHVVGDVKVSGSTILSGIATINRVSISTVGVNTTVQTGIVYVYLPGVTEITLPSSPSVGDTLKLINRSGITTAVVNRNGSNIMSFADDIELDELDGSFNFVYADSSEGWVVSR